MDVNASHVRWGKIAASAAKAVSFDGMRTAWILLWMMLAPLLLLAQRRVPLRYQLAEGSTLPKGLATSQPDTAAARLYLERLPALLQGRGYWAASVDSVLVDSSGITCWLYTGRQYRWGRLRADSSSLQWLQRLGYPVQGWQQQAQQPATWPQQLLDALANRGYPFAGIGWDSLQLENDQLSGVLRIESGPLYRLDSVQQVGRLRVKRNFLHRYLHITPGMPYQQQVIDEADRRLDEWLFAERQAPSALKMLGTGSVLQVDLSPRRANVLNVLVGLMPASTQTPNNQLQLTGDINLILRNAFGTGETLGANWQQIQYKSPRLNLLYQQPFVFNSRAGLDFNFDLLRKDTQFLNLQMRLGIPYQIDARQTARLFYQLQQNSVASADTTLVKQTRQLPDLADFSVNHLGLEWEYNSTDYRFNPREGWWVVLTAMGGIKRLRTNNDIIGLKDPADPQFDFARLYDTVRLRSYQLRLRTQVQRYWPVGQQATVKTALQGAWLQSDQYYRNELYQIGGFRLLRGFDEEAIFARGFAVSTVEYRYLTGKNGYLFAFADAGWAQYKDQRRQFSHQYIGMGVGLNIETKISQINLSWAVGKRNDLPLSLRQSKIHLGFVNYF
jgi:outer membrane protein assembly factor BamA